LAATITRRIGDGWISDLPRLRELEKHADDPGLHEVFRAVKHANKQRLAGWIQRRLGIQVSTDALFDVQVKRLHEYKRQLLNILQVVMRYHRLLDQPDADLPPRVVLFAAKAAPAYARAKLIIKLIWDVARTINRDERIGDRLKVVFLPNYGVSLAELIIPAADLSEQISTAGMEASGTGNMKFAMNGALTIGTLDGANIEIREAVGAKNFFLFGLTAEEVAAQRPQHDPWETYHGNAAVRRALDAVANGDFNSESPELFRPIAGWLTHDRDHYMLMADIEAYLEAQQRVDTLWSQPAAWTRSAILNVARIGYFSSDRAVHEYAEQIWNVGPVPIELPSEEMWKTPLAEARARPAEKTAKRTMRKKTTKTKQPAKTTT
jgi:starch phosphorylase